MAAIVLTLASAGAAACGGSASLHSERPTGQRGAGDAARPSDVEALVARPVDPRQAPAGVAAVDSWWGERN